MEEINTPIEAPIEVETPMVETPEVKVEPDVETPEEFDPNNITFDDEEGKPLGEHQFGKYNLDKFADTFGGFENPELKELFNGYATTFEEMGVSQEVAEFILQDKIDTALEVEKKTQSQIKEELNMQLSNEEKRNYNSISNNLSKSLAGSELEGMGNAIMQNPKLVKLVYQLQKQTLAGNPTAKKSFEKSGKAPLDPDSVLDTYMNRVRMAGTLTKESKTKLINDIANEASNRDEVLKQLSKYL